MSPPPAKLNAVGGGGPGGVAAGACATTFTARVAARTAPVRVRLRNGPNFAFMLPPLSRPGRRGLSMAQTARGGPMHSSPSDSPPNGGDLPNPGKDHLLFARTAGW